MSLEAVGKRYAQAVFELGKESGQLPALAKQIRSMAEVFQGSEELRAVLTNPLVADDAREKILVEIGQRLGMNETAQRTLRVLAQNRRLAALPEIARALDRMVDEDQKTLRATVTSADPVCGSLQLPQGATSSQVLLSRGLCDAAYAGCGSARGSVVQFLADLGGLYTKTSPARMIVRCDKSLCGNRGLTKIRLNYSLLGNAALGPAPACATKNRIGQSQEVCVDYRSSSRDNAGDSHLHLLLTHDARISVS